MTQNRFSSPLLGDRSAPVRFQPKLACHSWTELENLTSNCQACQLHQSRTRVVRGRYSQQKQAELLIIGEGPGKVEDIEGLAFVGDSGKLLDIMLDSVGLDDFYITNVVRCRPPGNRNPTLAECESCWGFLQSEIALVRPKAILCLGKMATKVLLNSSTKFEKLLQNQHQYLNYPVWVTYHPAYLLRQPQLSEHSPKWETWQILCQIKLHLTGCRLGNNDNSLLDKQADYA